MGRVYQYFRMIFFCDTIDASVFSCKDTCSIYISVVKSSFFEIHRSQLLIVNKFHPNTAPRPCRLVYRSREFHRCHGEPKLIGYHHFGSSSLIPITQVLCSCYTRGLIYTLTNEVSEFRDRDSQRADLWTGIYAVSSSPSNVWFHLCFVGLSTTISPT